jgi:hypothetical protein
MMARIVLFVICVLVSALPSHAILLDFENLPVGTVPDSLSSSYLNITTYREVRQDSDEGRRGNGTLIYSGTGAGTISSFLGSSALSVSHDRSYLGYWTQIRLGLEFIGGVSEFSVDLGSWAFTANLQYSGFDAMGQPISGRVGTSGYTFEEFSTHQHVVAPEGGYITGFYVQMQDSAFEQFYLDNLDFSPISSASFSTPSQVPESGASALLLGLGLIGLCAVRRFLPTFCR